MDDNNKNKDEFEIIENVGFQNDENREEVESIDNEENENKNENNEEIESDNEENENNNEKNENKGLPTMSMLFKEDKRVGKNSKDVFESGIFKRIEEHEKSKKDNEIKSKLKNLMNCGKCKKNLQDLYLCPFCKKYACKNCFNRQYYYLKRDHTPCPLCRKMVKRAYLKSVTLLKAIAEAIDEDEDDTKKALIKFNPDECVPNCKEHNLNKIWAYCIDCDKYMCQACFYKEGEEHKDHRCVNYEKYLELNVFFGNSFKNIKDFVLISEKTITDLQKLNADLENQKIALLNFATTLSEKIDSIFSEEQEKINEYIATLTQKVSDFNNFRRNIKSYVTDKIPNGYSEFNNLEEIKKEITNRVGELKIETPTKEFENLENKYKRKINFSKLEEKININKERIKSGIHTKVQNNENYKFNIEISADKEEVFFFLEINNNINGKENINSYLVKVEISDMNKNFKTIYLEMDNDKEDKDKITFINSISRKELFNNYKKGYIHLKIFYLDIE